MTDVPSTATKDVYVVAKHYDLLKHAPVAELLRVLVRECDALALPLKAHETATDAPTRQELLVEASYIRAVYPRPLSNDLSLSADTRRRLLLIAEILERAAHRAE